MKEKFLRIISPLTLAIVIVLDISVFAFAVFAVQKLIEQISVKTILFALIELTAIIIAALTSKEVICNGVIFRSGEMEFTGLDQNNIFEYEIIEKAEIQKDEKASLTKNFNDRHSFIILSLKDSSVVTVDIGLSTKKTLLKIKKEIDQRIN